MAQDFKTLAEADVRLLGQALTREKDNYRRLLRLAWRQNSYMKRQDVLRLDANSREWNRHLPRANAARLARECADAYAAKTGQARYVAGALGPTNRPRSRAGATNLVRMKRARVGFARDRRPDTHDGAHVHGCRRLRGHEDPPR